jgi:hypothetical protein
MINTTAHLSILLCVNSIRFRDSECIIITPSNIRPYSNQTLHTFLVSQSVHIIWHCMLCRWQCRYIRYKKRRLMTVFYAFKIMYVCYLTGESRDSSVGTVMGYRLDGRDLTPGRNKIFFSKSQCPDRHWGPPSLLSNGYRELFLRE